MSETKAQFRDRIRALYWTVYNKVMRDAGPYGSHRAETFAAEAVYAAALRDFRAYAGEAEYDPYPDMQASGLVDDFAASLGIDLSDEVE